jgi:hypothetical protein
MITTRTVLRICSGIFPCEVPLNPSKVLTVYETLPKLRPCIFAVLALLLSGLASSCSIPQPRAAISQAKLSRVFRIGASEVIPEIISLYEANALPGMPRNFGESELNALPALCLLDKRHQTQRFVVDVEPPNEPLFRYVLLKPRKNDKWIIVSAWTIKRDGSLKMLQARQVENGRFHAQGQGGDSSSQNSNATIGGTTTDHKPVLIYSNQTRYQKAEEVFLNLARADLLPHISKGDWEVYDIVPGPRAAEAAPHPLYAEFWIPLSNRSADLFFLFGREKAEGAWKLSSVVKLYSAGTAELLKTR